MKEKFLWKIKRVIIYPMLRFVTGHKYSCCNTWCKRCSRCKYVLDEEMEP